MTADCQMCRQEVKNFSCAAQGPPLHICTADLWLQTGTCSVQSSLCQRARSGASAPVGRQHAPEGDPLWVCGATPGRCSLRAGKTDCALCAVQVTATAANSRQAAGRSPEEYIQALWEMHLTDLMLPLQDMLPEKQLESLADQFREAIEPLVHALPRDEDGGVVDETRKLWARAVA